MARQCRWQHSELPRTDPRVTALRGLGSVSVDELGNFNAVHIELTDMALAVCSGTEFSCRQGRVSDSTPSAAKLCDLPAFIGPNFP